MATKRGKAFREIEGVTTLVVKSALPPNPDGSVPIALWDVDPNHPGNEIFVAGDKVAVVADTPRVKRRLAAGVLTEVEGATLEAPTLTALNPNTAVLGSADITMVCVGTGFINGLTEIFFNGFPEPTTFIDETQVSTGVKPSIFSVAEALPVYVSNPGLGDSAPLDFTFTVSAGTLSVEPTTRKNHKD